MIILSNLKTALRKQDWFTVALEVSILVLSIYAGLQVDAWRQMREKQEV
jgi:hypothetical protein